MPKYEIAESLSYDVVEYFVGTGECKMKDQWEFLFRALA